MSSLNGFQGQPAGRPAARPAAEQTQGLQPQAAWAQQGQQGYPNQWQQQQSPQQAGYAQPGYAPQQAAAPYQGSFAASPDPYAPQFEPYAPVAAAPQQTRPAPQQPAYQPQSVQQQYQPQAQGYGQGQQQYTASAQSQWPVQQADPRGFDVGTYLPQSAVAQAQGNYRGADQRHLETEPSLADWNQGQQGYQQGDQYAQAHGDIGFAQPAGGELDPAYAEEDGQEYEADEPVRSRRPLMIAAALAGAIFVGGGLAYSYKAIFGGGTSGTPPIIKSANEPSKTKPADAGGKQFAHSDSKIMGRLGDGDSSSAATGNGPSGEVEANGTRKVATLVVGRDGSIQAPAAAPSETPAPVGQAPADPAASGGVPGLTLVDALGPKTRNVAAAVAAGAPEAAQAATKVAEVAAQKLVATPPAAQKPVVIAKATLAAAAVAAKAADATGSIDAPAAAPAPPVKKVKKVAAAAAPAASSAAAAPVSTSVATTGSGANGFVAVLASVPRSDTSRIDALKRFADMQQKYGNVLGGKTPDVADANLGSKGAYHRLVVGPPGSREQASTVCSQLKSQGYADCWVTSY